MTKMETDQSRELLWKQLVNRARRQAALFGISAVAAIICFVYAQVNEISHESNISVMTEATLRRKAELLQYKEKATQCTVELRQVIAELQRCISAKR